MFLKTNSLSLSNEMLDSNNKNVYNTLLEVCCTCQTHEKQTEKSRIVCLRIYLLAGKVSRGPFGLDDAVFPNPYIHKSYRILVWHHYLHLKYIHVGIIKSHIRKINVLYGS